eukprot:1161561-Pelagomonas_calceolata.AAC.7
MQTPILTWEDNPSSSVYPYSSSESSRMGRRGRSVPGYCVQAALGRCAMRIQKPHFVECGLPHFSSGRFHEQPPEQAALGLSVIKIRSGCLTGC